MAVQRSWRPTAPWSVYTSLNLTGSVFNSQCSVCIQWAVFPCHRSASLLWICRRRWSGFWKESRPATQKRSSSSTTNTESSSANGCYSYSECVLLFIYAVLFCNVWNLEQDKKSVSVCLCRLGFSVLVYGLGSKKALLEDFRESQLAQEIHLVVNGFFPSITLKSVSIHKKISSK